MSAAEVNGKYSEDMFYDYASNFIDSNASKPFFLVFFNLVQKPWVPTPDDAAFANWNPDTDDTDPPNTTVTICQAWLITSIKYRETYQ